MVGLIGVILVSMSTGGVGVGIRAKPEAEPVDDVLAGVGVRTRWLCEPSSDYRDALE